MYYINLLSCIVTVERLNTLVIKYVRSDQWPSNSGTETNEYVISHLLKPNNKFCITLYQEVKVCSKVTRGHCICIFKKLLPVFIIISVIPLMG